jgi:hypothetical protein
MRIWFIGFALLVTCSVFGQVGKTYVYKVKAPPVTCEIMCREEFFLLEKDSYVKVNYDKKDPKPEVTVLGARILSEKDGVYKLRMLGVGTVVVNAFRTINGKQKVVAIMRKDIKPPLLYFCGVALDSSSKVLKLGPCHMWAYSAHFKKKLPVNKFSMLFYEDYDLAIKRKKNNKEPASDTLKADTCKLTKAMLVHLQKFQPNYNRMMFYNIVCTLPDGTKRVLEPFELLGSIDTLANSRRTIFTVKKKEKEEQ